MRGAHIAENGGKTGCGRQLLIGVGVLIVLTTLRNEDPTDITRATIYSASDNIGTTN